MHDKKARNADATRKHEMRVAGNKVGENKQNQNKTPRNAEKRRETPRNAEKLGVRLQVKEH
jgi:hypothetical protein